jgi:nucleoid-associated protein YgaU
MIEKRSRYRKTPIVELPQPEGEPLRLIGLRDIPEVPSVFSVTPVAGDRLDLLAHRHYRDPTQFFRIADASDQLDPFDVLELGIPLPIPPNR